MSQCNFGRYYDVQAKQCLPCNQKCLSCVDRADKCLSCKEGKWPFLNNNDCVQTCPDGKIGNVKANQCQDCSKECATCHRTAATCTSCHLTDDVLNLKWLSGDQCMQTCPPKTSVEQGTVCQDCDPSCAECSGSPTHCTRCKDNMKFDPISHTCTAECEEET